jgi:hypothetical protein
MATTERSRVDGLRGARYGEILLVHSDDDRFRADVWTTMGVSDCPPHEFEALDADEITATSGAVLALKNGPRHWVLDAIEGTGRASAPTARFGTLEMWRAATIDFGTELPTPGAYVERRVARDTVFEWSAGTPLHELRSPAGSVYVMQALSHAVDGDQTLDTLGGLEGRLAHPSGWTFSTRTQGSALRLLSDVDGVATVVQDELANTYQRVDRTD